MPSYKSIRLFPKAINSNVERLQQADRQNNHTWDHFWNIHVGSAIKASGKTLLKPIFLVHFVPSSTQNHKLIKR